MKLFRKNASTSIKDLLLQSISLCLLLSVTRAVSKKVSMKIVEEPSNYGVNSYQQQAAEPEGLKMRVVPSNFSGPPHLQRLNGKCFNKLDNEYKYEFCPFANVTQQEQSLRWNPYSGVLGVWQEWEIENNTFTAMIMREGDSCGAVFRTVKVIFKCGEENSIEHVSEPETCHYEMIFHTPYTCHPHAMLVYPTLPEHLQHEWDLLEGHWLNEEYTLQGYNKLLHKIFEEAGLQLPQAKKDRIAEQAKHKEKEHDAKDETHFESLDVCKEEYKKLKEEIEGLKTLLEVYQHENYTQGSQDMYNYENDGEHMRYRDYRYQGNGLY